VDVMTRFNLITNQFSTAGKMARDFSARLENLRNSANSPEMAAMFNRIRSDFIRRFNNSFDSMRDSLLVAKKYGPEAYTEANGLLTMLNPMSYRHINEYLAWKYGDTVSAMKPTNQARLKDYTYETGFLMNRGRIGAFLNALNGARNSINRRNQPFFLDVLKQINESNRMTGSTLLSKDQARMRDELEDHFK